MRAETLAYLEWRYEKLRLLKETAKSRVYLAADRQGGLVVWKEIFLTGLPYGGLKKLPPGPWPRVIHGAEDGEKTLVIEEYVKGESLRERLEAGRHLSEKEAREILLQLCRGLQVLHGEGLIHRDIKPSNILLEMGAGCG